MAEVISGESGSRSVRWMGFAVGPIAHSKLIALFGCFLRTMQIFRTTQKPLTPRADAFAEDYPGDRLPDPP